MKQGFSHLFDPDSEIAGPAMIEISFPTSFSPLTESITEICFICLTESKLHRYRRSSEDWWSLWKRLMWVREHQSLGYVSNTNAVSHCLKMIAQYCLLDFLEKKIIYITSGIAVQLQYTTLLNPHALLQNMFNYVADYLKPQLTAQNSLVQQQFCILGNVREQMNSFSSLVCFLKRSTYPSHPNPSTHTI